MFFLFLLSVRYFASVRLPDDQNRLFSFVLICGMADIMLDSAGSYAIENASIIPVWIHYLTNTFFYSLQIMFPVALCVYLLQITGRLRREYRRPVVLLAVPAAAIEIMLLTNRFTGAVFYVNDAEGYVHGPLFGLMYICAGVYLAVSFGLACSGCGALTGEQFAALTGVTAVTASAIVIQSALPQYLLTGMAITISLALLYFFIDNPSRLTDEASRTFNCAALTRYLGGLIEKRAEFSVVSVEPDDMQRLNRFFGFSAGNEILRAIAAYLKKHSRGPVFRMTGARFCIICPGGSGGLSDTVRARFGKPWWILNQEFSMSATVCLLECGRPDASPEDLLNIIDNTFSEVKKSGRGAFGTVGADEVKRQLRQNTAAAALKSATETGEGFEVYFQPIWSEKRKAFVFAEALLRFSHPLIGTMEPGEFIPVAEKNGYMRTLDILVLSKVCEFIKKYDPETRWGLEGLDVNLSAADFMHLYLSERMVSTLKKYGVTPSYLNFAISESVAEAAWMELAACMNYLAGKGFRFTLDNFGSDYANILQVVKLPFSVVKLSPELLAGGVKDPDGGAIFGDTVSMFRDLGYTITASGIETEAEADKVRGLNIDYQQGFRLARPMPEEEFVRFLDERL